MELIICCDLISSCFLLFFLEEMLHLQSNILENVRIFLSLNSFNCSK